MCNHPDKQFDIRCDECHKRVQAMMRRQLFDDLVEDGISPEDAEWLIREVESMSKEMRERITT